jgi:methionyl-tRNA formyltransferase
MSNTAQTPRLPNVLFLGMQSRFSYPSLYALLGAGIQVSAVVIPAEQSIGANLPVIQMREQPQMSRMMLRVLNSSVDTSILELARERDIPLWEVRQLSDPETIRVLAAYHPDMICVACFSKHIPHGILDIPPLGCLNVHPSLLPTNRGPEPLFWTFREGIQRTGVTIHLMDEGMDSGAIVAQEVIEIPDGISYSELDEQSAALGGNLLARSVWELYHTIAKPVAQDETKSSYHAFPSEDDFVVPVAEWDARRVYNFICGVASLGTQMILRSDNEAIHIHKAISYSFEDMDDSDWRVHSRLGEEFWVRCMKGSVLVM